MKRKRNSWRMDTGNSKKRHDNWRDGVDGHLDLPEEKRFIMQPMNISNQVLYSL